MNHNPVRSISYLSATEASNEAQSTDGTAGYFAALRSLSITHTNIAEWHSVDEIAKFPRLTILRFSHNAVCVANDQALTR